MEPQRRGAYKNLPSCLGIVSHRRVCESALYDSYPMALQCHDVSLLASEMSHFHTSNDSECTSHCATKLCKGSIQTSYRVVFPYEDMRSSWWRGLVQHVCQEVSSRARRASSSQACVIRVCGSL